MYIFGGKRHPIHYPVSDGASGTGHDRTDQTGIVSFPKANGGKTAPEPEYAEISYEKDAGRGDDYVFCKDLVLTTLKVNGVKMNPGCRVDEINAQGVRAFQMEQQKELFFPADTVILAGGFRCNYENEFADKDYPVIRVGDAIRAGKIKDAIYTAYHKALEI